MPGRNGSGGYYGLDMPVAEVARRKEELYFEMLLQFTAVPEA